MVDKNGHQQQAPYLRSHSNPRKNGLPKTRVENFRMLRLTKGRTSPAALLRRLEMCENLPSCDLVARFHAD